MMIRWLKGNVMLVTVFIFSMILAWVVAAWGDNKHDEGFSAGLVEGKRREISSRVSRAVRQGLYRNPKEKYRQPENTVWIVSLKKRECADAWYWHGDGGGSLNKYQESYSPTRELCRKEWEKFAEEYGVVGWVYEKEESDVMEK